MNIRDNKNEESNSEDIESQEESEALPDFDQDTENFYNKAQEQFDVDGDEDISVYELGRAIRSWFESEKPTDSDLNDLVFEFDKDNNGTLSKEEFCRLIKSSNENDHHMKKDKDISYEPSMLEKMYFSIDKDKNG